MLGAVVGKMAFKLDDSAGALQDLSTYSPKGSISKGRDMLNSDTFDGSVSHSTTPGLRDGQEFTIDFLYHATAFAHLKGVDELTTGVSQTYEYGPEGSGSGKPKLTGECFLKSFNLDSSVAAIVTMNAVFVQTGAQTWGTFS